MPGGEFVQTFWQDLRYGARMLMKEPGFTFTTRPAFSSIIDCVANGHGAGTVHRRGFTYKKLLARPANRFGI
jgi:hypothetical protein